MNEDLLKILVKVKAMYQKFGIKSVTMDDVAKELGISKKTLYQYVKDKDDLVEKIVEMHEQENDKNFMALYSNKLNAIQLLLLVNQIMQKMLKEHNPSVEYDLKKYHPEVFKRASARNHAKIFKSVLDNLKKGKKEGLYREDLNVDLIAKLYVLRIDSLMDSEIITREEILNSESMKQLMEYHIRGISNENGIKEYEKYKDQIENINIM